MSFSEGSKITFKFSDHKRLKSTLALMLSRGQKTSETTIKGPFYNEVKNIAESLGKGNEFICDILARTAENVKYYIKGIKIQGVTLKCPITPHTYCLVGVVAEAYDRASQHGSISRPPVEHAIETAKTLMERITNEGVPEADGYKEDEYFADLFILTYEKAIHYATGQRRKQFSKEITPIIEKGLEYLRARKDKDPDNYEVQLRVMYAYFSQLVKVRKALIMSEESIELHCEITDRLAEINPETTKTMKDALKADATKKMYTPESVICSELGLIVTINDEGRIIRIPVRSQEIRDALHRQDPLTLDDLSTEQPANKELSIIDDGLRINYIKKSQTYSILVPFEKIQEALRPQ